jgi:cell division protein FtsZ
MQKLVTNSSKTRPTLHFIGVGNAGVNIVDRLFLARFGDAACTAINTDIQSLNASVTTEKILLGMSVSRGLGTGGDVDLAANAYEQSSKDLQDLASSGEVIFIIGGLGGGTASACLPRLADHFKQAGRTVFAFITLPFGFEGKRKESYAKESLQLLQDRCDLVLAFDNNRLPEVTSQDTPVAEAFQAADQVLSAAVTGVAAILECDGPLEMTAGDVITFLRSHDPMILFAAAAGNGSNRVHEALTRALRSPWIPGGRKFSEATSLLVQIFAPPDLSYREVQALLTELQRHLDDEARIGFGVSIRSDQSTDLSLCIFASCQDASVKPGHTGNHAPADDLTHSREPDEHQDHTYPQPDNPPRQKAEPENPPPDNEPETASEPVPPNPSQVITNPEESTSRGNQSELFHPEEIPVVERVGPQISKKQPPKAHQQTLQFESAARGRFEKSEPTIVEGENLDVPTYLRRKGRIR